MREEESVMFGRTGPWEIGLIVLIILIVFGVGKLPQVGGAIGKGLRAFRRGQSGEEEGEEEIQPKTATRKSASTRKSTSKS
jgi:sec-independent protein translocase protein TatA